MSRDHNHVSMTGRLGRDPELKSGSGWTKMHFSLAVDASYKDKNGRTVEKTNWNPCIAWGQTAETIAKYCRKGDRILVEGRLETREGTDKQGAKRWYTEVNVSNIVFLGGKKEGSESGGSSYAKTQQQNQCAPQNDGYSLRQEDPFADDSPIEFPEFLGDLQGTVDIPF